MAIKISEMASLIERHYFKDRERIQYGLLFLGPPGVGKSTSVESASRDIARRLGKQFMKVCVRWEAGKGFVVNGSSDVKEVLSDPGKYFLMTDFRLSTIEPSDLTGILRSREGIAFYDPLLWSVLHSCADGVLFLDEITWIQRDDVWAIVPQLVLDKIAGSVKLSSGTMVVAAGNRVEDAGIVRQIHNPLLNRFKIYEVLPPSYQDWANWMDSTYGEKWDKSTMAFLARFASEGYMLKVPETGEGLDNFPTPRTWTWLALEREEGFDSLDDAIGLLGNEIGRKFHAFASMRIDVESVVNDPSKFGGFEFDKKYAFPVMLANWASATEIESKKKRQEEMKNRVERLRGIIEAMGGESVEFVVLFMASLNKDIKVDYARMICRTMPEVAKRMQFIVDKLISS